jgi:hypothetical protein
MRGRSRAKPFISSGPGTSTAMTCPRFPPEGSFLPPWAQHPAPLPCKLRRDEKFNSSTCLLHGLMLALSVCASPPVAVTMIPGTSSFILRIVLDSSACRPCSTRACCPLQVAQPAPSHATASTDMRCQLRDVFSCFKQCNCHRVQPRSGQ